MCANDVACAGAKPLFFLDYVAVGKNVPERVAQLVAGVAEGCVQAGCALIDVYKRQENHLACKLYCARRADSCAVAEPEKLTQSEKRDTPALFA